jgi:hypothetical protein
MIERGDSAGFALQAFTPVGVARKMFGKNLDGYRTIEPRIFRAIDLAYRWGGQCLGEPLYPSAKDTLERGIELFPILDSVHKESSNAPRFRGDTPRCSSCSITEKREFLAQQLKLNATDRRKNTHPAR